MIRFVFSFFLLVNTCAAYSQTSFEINRVGSNDFGSFTFYDGLGGRTDIPYTKIKGSAFWDDKWNTAIFFDKNNRSMGIYMAKINLATHEIYYKQNEDILAANKGLITKVIFNKSADTTLPAAIFSNSSMYIFSNKENGKYAQILNNGKVQLLKITTQEVATADSLFGTMKRFYFRTDIKYFLCRNKETDYIKKLKKENILMLIPSSQNYASWIESNNINFKKEEDIIKFLNYYNSIQQ